MSRVAAATRLHAAGIEHALVSLGGDKAVLVYYESGAKAEVRRAKLARSMGRHEKARHGEYTALSDTEDDPENPEVQQMSAQSRQLVPACGPARRAVGAA